MSESVDAVVVGAGQAGLAASRALQQAKINHVVLEAGAEVGGAWPRYHDSLRLLSPARMSALPGRRFPGDQSRYPTRDEVVGYLRDYATGFDLPVRTNAAVCEVARVDNGFVVHVRDGAPVRARAVVAASGGFGRPSLPALQGAGAYRGRLLHAADYHRPQEFAGQRVVVVGGRNSAVQIGAELANVAETTLASRAPVVLRPQAPLGIDVHYWMHWTGLDRLPLGRRAAMPSGVLDNGRYAHALRAGRPDRRDMFHRFTTEGVIWNDGRHERVDAVILATGYRPDLEYLRGLGALAPDGYPIQCHGLSLIVAGLGFVGVPGQRSAASATLRGVGPDARRVVRALGRHLSLSAATVPRCRRASHPIPLPAAG